MLVINIYNHHYAVEFDTVQNFEFGDINYNCSGLGHSPYRQLNTCYVVQILHDRANPVLSLAVEGNTNTILSGVHGEHGTTILSLVHQGETLPPQY